MPENPTTVRGAPPDAPSPPSDTSDTSDTSATSGTSGTSGGTGAPDGPRETEYGRITEAGLQRLRDRIGRVEPVEQPFVRYVNPDSTTHAARAIGDTNPLYTDPDYAATTPWGRTLAPPVLFYAVAWGSWDLRRGEGLAGVHGLHAGDHWWYPRPVLAGDELRATKKLIRLDPMEGRLAGTAMVMQVREIDVFNQRDELVARQHMPVVRAERNESKRRGRYADVRPATYTADEIAGIDEELAAERARGGTPRYWEDVAEGSPLDPVVKGPLTVPDMITWLQAIGSPHLRSGRYWLDYRRAHPKVAVVDPTSGIPQAVERVHWDSYLAAEVGMPAAYDYGSQRGGYATYFLTNWIGDTGWLVEMEVRYRGMFFLGDVVRISGTVDRRWRDAETGQGLVEISFASTNQRGEDVMPGRAVVALPSRAGGPVRFPAVDPDEGSEDGR